MVNGLVLVGGIPYSGKSSVCLGLEKAEPDKYIYLDSDAFFEEVAQDGEKFFRYLKISDIMLYHGLKNTCAQAGILAPQEQLNFFGVSAAKGGFFERFEGILNGVAFAYMAESIANAGEGSVPVIESLFIEKENRAGFYRQLGELVKSISGDDPEFDAKKKVLVYFDLGLQTCLKRYHRGRKKKYKTITTKKSKVISDHKKQELPEDGEIPNLEIIVIKSTREINAAVQHVRTICAL